LFNKSSLTHISVLNSCDDPIQSPAGTDIIYSPHSSLVQALCKSEKKRPISSVERAPSKSDKT